MNVSCLVLNGNVCSTKSTMVAPWNPVKTWKQSRASACSNSANFSASASAKFSPSAKFSSSSSSSAKKKSANATSTSGLTTDLQHTDRSSLPLFTFTVSPLSKWRFRSNKLHELSNKSLGHHRAQTQNFPKLSGLQWGAFRSCGSLSTQCRRIEIR